MAGDVCAECARKCAIVHGKKKDPSPLSSFFKVIIGKEYSEALFLPPKFGCTLLDLVGQETQLEDSNGREWAVTLSNLNGSLVFLEGWHNFSFEHGLQIGDFLVFHYITRLHFVVQIYDRSGCERTNFSKNCKPTKKPRTGESSFTTDKGSIIKQGSTVSVLHGSDKGTVQSQWDASDVKVTHMSTEHTSTCQNKNGRLNSVCKENYTEKPYFMIDRDPGYKQVEDSRSAFDLSLFEMRETNSGKKKCVCDERSYHHVSPLVTSFSLVGVDDDNIGFQKVEARFWPLSVAKPEMMGGNKDSEVLIKVPAPIGHSSFHEHMTKYLLTPPPTKPGKHGKETIGMSNEVIKKCTTQETRVMRRSCARTVLVEEEQAKHFQKHFTRLGGMHGNIAEVKQRGLDQRHNPSTNGDDKTLKMVKTEEIDANGFPFSSVIDGDKTLKVVKTEAVDSTDLSFLSTNTCLVPSDEQPYLELPRGFSSATHEEGMGIGRMIVFIRDPLSRLWPVFYNERNGIKFLSSGWESFRDANDIRAGDACSFEAETESSDEVYAVRIIRKRE